MLGRLAKWLRLIGYDTLYLPLPDTEILLLAQKENRLLLTRDKRITERRLVKKKIIKCLFIKSDFLEEQLQQIATELNLSLTLKQPLCTLCNKKILLIPKERVKGKVPPFVFMNHQEFGFCPTCKKYYWKGTHWVKINNTLTNLF